MTQYDPIKAEKEWRTRPVRRGKRGKARGERHDFPHRLVRFELSARLERLGCNQASSILDIGCGTGSDVRDISRLSMNITGVDVLPEAVAAFTKKGYRGVVGDAKTLPFPDASFDYVICPAVLHHLIGQGDLADYVREFVRVTRPGGYLVVLEPNVFSISGLLMNIANSLKPGITGLVPHERAMSPWRIMRAFAEAGLTDVDCSAASFSWNRLPLFVSKRIAGFEGAFRHRKPFCYLGWFSIVSGRRAPRSA